MADRRRAVPRDAAPLAPWFLLGAACVGILVAYWLGWTQGIVDATPAICDAKVDSIVVRKP